MKWQPKIASLMFNAFDADEIQSERDYFWAVAFIESDKEINNRWRMFECEWELSFQEIQAIVDDFNNFTDGRFEVENLELFVAQQIWQYKCTNSQIFNPEFVTYLKKSATTKHLFRALN